MANDFKHKEPTKTEKVLYELMMAQQNMERGLWSTSSVVMALGMLLKVKPEDVANALVNKETDIKEYSNKVNEEIKKIEAAKKPAAQSEVPAIDAHAGHNHPDIESEPIKEE